MTMTMSGSDAYLTRKLRNKDRMDDGQCLYCPPNRGENARKKGNYRWDNDRQIHRKGKDKK